ncbi:hypothetical protein DPMN_158055 [Dreissena polymorpha]|uniref:Uncharacterized protein n=1 Tax=Dreissena polymorpha TaxID=45954 RepID=A0A9D4IMU8_DREPO|nr:hypothetical protein DPMN_158055 [Dreissena polymorpha]
MYIGNFIVDHVFQQTATIKKPDIHKTNVLTKYHDDWTKHVTFRVPPPPDGHVFLPIRTIFELNHWAKNVSYRLYTCFHYIHIKKTAPPPGGHAFQMLTTIFKLAKNVTSREKDPRPGGHVFLTIPTIFTLNRRIQKTNVLTKYHKDWTKNVTSRVFTCLYYIHIEKNAPPPGGHFHDDWAKIVTSRVFTRFLYSHIRNTAPPPGSNLHEDWASNVTSTRFTSFKLSRGIIGTNVLTKFHEDRTRSVASRMFTRQMLTTDARCTMDKRRSQRLTILHVVLR